MMMQPAMIDTWVELLQVCRQKKDSQHAKRLHATIHVQGMELYPGLANYLIPTLVECGSLPHAQQLFDRLPFHHRNLHSWNSLLSGYAESADPTQAFPLFSYMQQQAQGCVRPSRVTYLALLAACTSLRDPSRGHALHADIVCIGIEDDVLDGSAIVGNTLLDMYAKCRLFVEARYMFDNVPVQGSVSWNALIAGYAEHGMDEEAWNCFQQMQLKGVCPVAVTFICSLKACQDVHMCQELHNEATKRGFDRDLHVGSTLVDAYAQCRSPVEGSQVFYALHSPDIVSWNALIAGYAECGLGEKVVDCLQQMQLEGICSDSITFVCSLVACCTTKDYEMGGKIHIETTKRGLERDLHVGNTLVDMYAKCGLLKEAQHVFDGMLARDEESWTAMIAGIAEHGVAEEANNYFQKMLLEEILPVPIMLICILKACGRTQTLETGNEIHAEATKHGLERELHIGSALVDMYTECASFLDALDVFDKLPVRDTVAWNALIAAYTDHGMCAEAVYFFRQLLLQGIHSNSVTFKCGLKACGDMQDLGAGHELHSEATKRGLNTELPVSKELVDMYGKCGLLEEAQEVFDSLPVRDLDSWVALIVGYSEQGFSHETLKCFQEMQLDGKPCGSVTFGCCLKACGTIGSLESGRKVHAEITKRGMERELYTSSILVDMYGECGLLSEACSVFGKLPARSVVSWTAMIKAYGRNHEGNMAIQCFENMRDQDVEPSSITFLCLLAACSHSSLVLKGEKYFKLMREYGIKPTLDHYACMIDLYARSGLVYEAERLVAAMECPPSGIILYVLLTASKIYGKLEVGERCFQQLVEAHEEDSSAYLLMAEIYANAGRWKDVIKLEEMRKSVRAEKKPGTVFFEVNKQLHKFSVGVNLYKHQGGGQSEFFSMDSINTTIY